MNPDIKRRIEIEAEDSDKNPDAPVPNGAKVARGNRARSSVYSIRLNPEEVASVQALADKAGLPASTLVRSWIVERVRTEEGEIGDAEAELNAAQRHLSHVKRHLAQQ